MKYFAIYDNEGFYTSLRTTELYPEETMPIGYSIELTKEQWQEATVNECRVVNGQHSIVVPSQEEINDFNYQGVRYNRNKLLAESDWTQMQDSPLTDAQKQEWAAYRQALRDLPETVDINNIIYPEKP